MGQMKEVEALNKFNQKKDKFYDELRDWTYETLSESKGGQEGGTVWSTGPTIDSLSVLNAVSMAEETFGIKIELDKIILKGGYESCDHFLEDFMPKLQLSYVKTFSEIKKEIDA